MENEYQNKFNLYEVDNNRIIISITYPNEIYFAGIVDINVVRGSISIMGYELTPGNSPVTAYSISEFCTFKISLLKKNFSQIDKSNFLALKITEPVAHTILSQCSNNSHLILVTKSIESDNFVSFIKSYELPILLKENFEIPLAKYFVANNSKNKFVEHNLWDQISNSFSNKLNPKVVLSGGKGVGKSTLLRYLVNKSLLKTPEVLIVDFDPGQSEFTVMGCLSAVLVREPLLGPNFSHFADPIKSLYIGDVSVNNCVEHYTRCMKHLINYCQSSYSHIPWFINTMGYTKSLGVMLLAEIIKFIDPTDIIQIESDKKNSNFCNHLLPDFLASVNQKMHSLRYYKYRLHVVSSTENNLKISGELTSTTKRNIATLAYFRKLIKCRLEGLLGAVPHKISTNEVDIIIEKPSSHEIKIPLTKFQKLCCINANLVALCNAETGDSLMQCRGYGIVRGFDDRTEEIFILTPLTEDQLEQINVIRMSSTIQLSEVVYKNQISFVNGQVPYLTYKQSHILSQPFKKSSSRIKFPVD